MSPWIGVDLDGVLAKYDDFQGPGTIGDPVIPMVNRVKRWLRAGKTVKIFTARARFGKVAIDEVRSWLVLNGLPPLEVTNIKDEHMIALYDDRAYRVETNTGRILGE